MPPRLSGANRSASTSPLSLGGKLCDAFEAYRQIYPAPCLCFEKAWGLYQAIAQDRELFFAYCGDCDGPYVQDRYALDYARCPFCELKQDAQPAGKTGLN